MFFFRLCSWLSLPGEGGRAITGIDWESLAWLYSIYKVQFIALGIACQAVVAHARFSPDVGSAKLAL